jgi:hypothetical protein
MPTSSTPTHIAGYILPRPFASTFTLSEASLSSSGKSPIVVNLKGWHAGPAPIGRWDQVV